MARKENLVAKIEKAYVEARAEETEEFHNAIVEAMTECSPSLENALLALDLVRFALMSAKYKEILGVVKLGDKPPVKKTK